jgi:hypothetical protein
MRCWAIPAPGWERRSVKRSAHIAQVGGVGNNWFFSHIDRSTNPPTVQSKFIDMQMQGGGVQSGVWVQGQLVVTREDNGDAPY